jgi:uncharacterized protein
MGVGNSAIWRAIEYGSIPRALRVVLALALLAPLVRCAGSATEPSLAILPEASAIPVSTLPLGSEPASLKIWPGAESQVRSVQAGSSIVLTPAGREAAVWYAVKAQYGKQSVPYLAPYELTVRVGSGSCWLAWFDHKQRQWRLHATPLSGAATVPIGLARNAAGIDGSFRFALLASGKPASIESLRLRYPTPPQGTAPVDYQTNVITRDGVQLASNVYLPFATRGPFMPKPPYPVILVRTPYPKEYVGAEYISWVSRFNAVVVIQYFRGRPGLSGKWPDSSGQPGLFDDHNGPAHFDALDTVRWIKARSFASDELLLVGGSALGLWVYQALPGLGTQASAAYCIAAAADVGSWAALQNGCIKRSNVEGWLGSFDFPPKLLERVRSEAHQPERWESRDFNNRAAQVQTPGWHETGWWDLDVEETIRSFKALNEQGGVGARGRQWLVIGPWTHEGIRTPRAGQMTFGYSSVAQNPSLMPLTWEGALWSAYQLGHNPFYSPPENHARVYFVGEQGSSVAPNNTWYELPTWPPQSKPLTLSIEGGKLSSKAVGQAWSASFDCDPANPIPTLGGANLPLGDQKVGPWDQRAVEGLPGVIKLRSEPLAKRLATAGSYTARLFVKTAAADTDVLVKLVDVYPDGRSLLIADRALRLSWWCEQRGLGPVQPGRTYEIRFTVAERAWVFEQGHRIGFDVQASNYPRFDVNPGTGAPLSGGRMVVQHNTLISAPAQPSQFILPQFDPTQAHSR